MQLELVNRESGSHHTVIQVIGIGGGGSNAVQRMIEHGLEGVQFVMANTDLQALERFQSPKAHMLPLGEKITGGLGAGGNPEVGREAAEEDVEKVRALLADTHMVFVTAGMGGGTGTGAAPVIARAAKELGKLCVGVVTTPFHFEGQRKFQLALQGVEELRKEVDTLIVIPNQLLLQVLESGTSVREAFSNADEVLRMGVKGIADLIIQPGDINVDFNDVCTVMRNGGEALMGIGISSGEDRALRATVQALENPLLSGAQMKGATGLLVQITADESFSLEEYSCIMNEINGYVDTVSATVISGIAIEGQKKDEIKVTVIATGFHVTDAFTDEAVVHSGKNRSGAEAYRSQARNPVANPLQNPLSTPLQFSRSSVVGGAPPPAAPVQGLNRAESVLEYQTERQNQSAEAGQALQMRQALQPDSAGRPDGLPYDMKNEGTSLAEEQLNQVSNTELQMLFSKDSGNSVSHSVPGSLGAERSRGEGLGQKRPEPQLPPGQNENLYVPTLLRRKRKR